MKIDMILESLPNSFSQFKMNYNMNKLKLTPVELMHELESAERSLGKQESAYHAESSSKPKRKPKGGKKNKKQKGTGPAVKPAAMKKPKDFKRNLVSPVHVQQPVQQTRSGRMIRKPARYALLGETYQVVLDNPDDDPTTYREALEDVDVQE
ncbi:uncharacterized protein LOC125420956 [Ziziphus jujuba]|uniref:Uncharacterized protein LOC125420956 n=1 Tax=Ziziphus jujuba TaxID=326968 RepID=A0ABM3IAW6_ZIZJJ|nr:uncharacterized protein LOC125420956 [Ziziphus jujuba]